MTFQEFIAIVSADLGREYQSDMIDGFKDYSAEPGATTQGFSFNLPTVSRCYSWARHEKWYYASRAGQGWGDSLEEAIAQSQLPIDEDEAA